MPLQSTASTTNPLCLSEVRTELGLSSSTRLCLNDSRVRSLAGRSSGTICLSHLLGKGVPSTGLPSGTTFISARIETWPVPGSPGYYLSINNPMTATITFNDNGSVSSTNTSSGRKVGFSTAVVTGHAPILSAGQIAATKYIGGNLASGTRANYEISYTNMQWETINYHINECLAWCEYGDKKPLYGFRGENPYSNGSIITWGNFVTRYYATNPVDWNGFIYPPVGYRGISGTNLSFALGYPGYYKGPLPSTSWLPLSSYPSAKITFATYFGTGLMAVRVTGTVNLRTGSTTFSYPLHLVCYSWDQWMFSDTYYRSRGFAKGAYSPFPGYKTSQEFFYWDR